jgi:aminocarboxymuconate-semialdehyde decarboxylase
MHQPSLDGLVDVHTHAIGEHLPDLSGYAGRWPSIDRVAPDAARLLFDGAVYREIDDRCWSAERRLRDMDADGVAVQVLSPIPVTLCHDQPVDGAAVLAAAQNDALAALAARAPDRFRVLGAVPLQSPELAVAELLRCVDELGFLGVEIGTRVGDLELSDPVFAPFFDAAARCGALVLVHPVDLTLDPRLAAIGVAFGLGMPVETATAAAALLTGRPQHPDLLLCLAHGGGALPQLLPRLDHGAWLAGRDEQRPSDRARRLWCDSLTYDTASLRLSLLRFGVEHVVLGTDYPFAAMESPAGSVLSGLDAALREAVGRDNAMSLLHGRLVTDRRGAAR